MTPVTIDPWTALRRHTSARIALGRAGGSLPTAELLRFSADHAAARDAVHAPFAAESLAAALGTGLIVASRAADRREYLRRPDLGRLLAAADEAACTAIGSACDLSVVVGDGLSPLAAERHAVAVLAPLLAAARAAGLSSAPVVVARQARVALGDEIAHRLHARAVIILLGERPGLGSPDSLGAYLTIDPRPGRRDSERNCVSNIRAGGCAPATAAAVLTDLLLRGLRLGASGIGLQPAEQRLTAGVSRLEWSVDAHIDEVPCAAFTRR